MSKTGVWLDGEKLVFNGFVEVDREVVNQARAADDLESAVHKWLEVGARALRGAQASVDSGAVEKVFAEMTARLDAKVEDAVRQVVEATHGLLDKEDGDLAVALADWREEVGAHFDATFNPDSKKSVLTRLEAILEKAREQQVESIRRVISPDREDSPL